MNTHVKFIVVGENIHCTRIFKVGGKFVTTREDGAEVITYTAEGQEQHLPIPQHLVESEDWAKGKLKHVVAAMWQGFYGEGEAQQAGTAYLEHLARVQEAHGAAFLDLNVDEFSLDVDERVHLIQWAAGIIQNVSSIPLSIDSSNVTILQAGLEACDRSKGTPLVNSVSLERMAAIDMLRGADVAVIAGATGETSMPTTIEERMHNFEKLLPTLTDAGLTYSDIYLDPLIFPASVNAQNSKDALDVIKALRHQYGSEIHFAPGLSNVSYGLPRRKLLNQVFTYLCIEHGCDGGIVDPRHINESILQNLDVETDAFKLAKAFLMGEDEFGMAYIRAVRKGII